jgi:hypothetical protein
MHVNVFQQKFTLEIKVPHLHKGHRPKDFSDALKHIDSEFMHEQRGHGKRRLPAN